MAKQTSLLSKIDTGAIFSSNRLYRLELWRIWNDSLPVLLFIMLNPSTADAAVNDATIRNCISRAKSMGYGGIRVVNLFAYCATSPIRMMKTASPTGSDNDRYITKAMKNHQTVIAAWGDNGDFMNRDLQIKALAKKAGRILWALRTTKKGQPGHPLYVAIETKPFVWYDPGAPQ